jgi:hypothetical protein
LVEAFLEVFAFSLEANSDFTFAVIASDGV